MKRIGLVTFYKDNYGSVLQCYATKYYVETLGYECDVLYRKVLGIEKARNQALRIIRAGVLALRYRDYLTNRRQMRNAAAVANSGMSAKSKQKLDFFSKTVLQPKPFEFDVLRSPQVANQYDYFIAGSDQVWTGSGIADPFAFLEFTEDKKKIALSVSFGVDKLHDFNEGIYRKSVSKFEHLSVREFSGVDIAKSLTTQAVTRLADPVMLLTRESWSEFADHGEMPSTEGCIFAHFLDYPSDETVNSIRLLAERFSLKVCCFAYSHKELESLPGFFLAEGSPYDYVAGIRDASFICTDSFHTAQFGVIFNKRFFVYERNYCHNNNQSSRIATLVEIYSCGDRYVNGKWGRKAELPLYAPNFDEIRRMERLKVRNYLDSCLHTKSVAAGGAERLSMLKPESDCTGCMACVAICPTGAISVVNSASGYRLPKVDTSVCIHCGKCKKACYGDGGTPLVTKLLPARSQDAFIAYSKNMTLLKESASGGAFASLATSFIQSGGLVAGSRLSHSEGVPTIEHVLIENVEDLPDLLGSKYVESDCRNAHLMITRQLRSGRRVLFCGTSCQVVALRRFLAACGVADEGLYTIDLVCHGVPGIALFEGYCDLLERRLSGTITDFRFRVKSAGHIEYTEKVKLDRDGIIEDVLIPQQESCYYRLFMTCESYRDSCYHCEYATINKPADITIGDYFEARDDYPELFRSGGPLEDVSYLNCLVVHGTRGKELLSCYGAELTLHKVGAEVVQDSHNQLCAPSNYTHMRLDAMDAYAAGGFTAVEKACLREKRKLAVLRALGKPVLALRKGRNHFNGDKSE